MQYRYYHSELEQKYHDTSNGWPFLSASPWKKSINAVIGSLGMLLSPHTFKSLNGIVTVRLFCVTFNGNPCETLISFYSPINTSDETFYNKLSHFVRHIPKHNVLIINRDMNAQIGKDGNNSFCSHNSPNRNEEYLASFSHENRLAYVNLKFQKERGKYGFIPTQITLKHSITNGK